MLSVPERSLRDRWQVWGLTAYRVGRGLRFRERELQAWIEAQKVAAPDPAFIPVAASGRKVQPSRRLTKQEQANWISSQVPWTCPCGRTVRGGGGAASHRRACATYRATAAQRLPAPPAAGPDRRVRRTDAAAGLLLALLARHDPVPHLGVRAAALAMVRLPSAGHRASWGVKPSCGTRG